MKANIINWDIYDKVYFLYIKTLIGKLIKKGKKQKALKIYYRIKENIKLNTKKEKKVSLIILFSILNCMSNVKFKEMRFGSQKREIPMSVSEKKKVLNSITTILRYSKMKKRINLDKVVDCIVSSSYNKGVMIINKQLKYQKAIINKMFLNILIPNNPKYKKKYNVSKKTHYEIFKDKTSL